MAEALVYEAPGRRAGKDPTGLTRTLVIWLYLGLAASAVSVADSIQEVWGLSSVDAATPISPWDDTPGVGEMGVMLSGLGALFQLLVGLVAGVLALKWIYRAALNARALARDVVVTPRWAMGWYFVPIANLWKPFHAMKEAWATGARPDAWSSVETPGLLRWWWGLWLVHNSLDNFSFRLWMRASTAGELSVAEGLSIVAAVLNVPLTLVFIQVVRQVATRQWTSLQQREFD